MGIEAIYPKPRTTVRCPEHKIYPYLLRDLAIVRPNHVWSADITYIPLRGGFLYLTAIIDWYSRYVLAWRLSNSLESSFCVDVLEEALSQRRPEIFNTDQGVQFTSLVFTGCLAARGIAISMDGAVEAAGQRVRQRATVADGEVRGGVPEGLRRRLAGGDELSESRGFYCPSADINRWTSARQQVYVAGQGTSLAKKTRRIPR